MEGQHKISDKKWLSYGQSKFALIIITLFTGFHIYHYLMSLPGTIVPAHGGNTILRDDAQRLVNNYSLKRFKNAGRGVMLSKRAIDFMFPTGSTDNCIFMYPAVEVLNGDSMLRIIVEPFTVKDPSIATPFQSKIFKTEALCPNECGSIN